MIDCKHSRFSRNSNNDGYSCPDCGLGILDNPPFSNEQAGYDGPSWGSEPVEYFPSKNPELDRQQKREAQEQKAILRNLNR